MKENVPVIEIYWCIEYRRLAFLHVLIVKLFYTNFKLCQLLLY